MIVPAPGRPTRRALLGLALATGGALWLLGPATGLGATSVVYSPDAAANAINDGAPGVTGLRSALRQAPIVEESRFSTARLVGKVSGRELADQPSAEAMAALLRRGQQVVVTRDGTTRVGGRVGVDEIIPNHWSVASAGMLRQALGQMGPAADGVIFYASPALVEQVGRHDPRRALPARNRALVAALAGDGRTFLEVYRGSLRPFPRAEMANHLTRWQARWPDARAGNLHVLIGPGIGATQTVIWGRIRASEAGRELLANGPGAFGLRSAEEGHAWLREYRDFLDRPEAAPAGSARIVRPGGVRLLVETDQRLRPSAVVRLRLARPSTATLALIDSRGQRRVFERLTVRRAATIRVKLPLRIRPGRYRLVVMVSGENLNERVSRQVRIVPSAAPARG